MINTKHLMVDNEGIAIFADPFYGKRTDGKHFEVTEYTSNITSTNGIQYYVKTGATKTRIAFEAYTTADAKLTLHEGASITATNLGTLATTINHNRQSSNSASTAVYGSGTITGSGNIIKTVFIPSNLGMSKLDDFILTNNTTYMLQIKPISGSAYCGLAFSWQE